MSDSLSTPLPAAAALRLSGWLTHLGVSPLAFDDTLALINPLLTVHRLSAKVVAKITETSSATTLVLQTGGAFKGFEPGQFLLIGVTIDGVRHRRAYSPRIVDGRTDRFAITIQRQPGGRVSNHVGDRLKVGDFIEIEQPGGAFTLPATLPAEVMMIAGGSGITPCLAMLEHLRQKAPHTRATLIYFARSRDDRIFANTLERLAADWPELRYVPVDSVANTPTGGSDRPQTAWTASAPQQVLTAELLDEVAPNWSSQAAYCCGPAPLMDAAQALWQAAGHPDRLHLEAFTPPKPNGDPNARHAVQLRRDELAQRFEAPGDQTILVAGENAGLNIKHGCRQGICHECTCRLESGSVRDLNTGERIDGHGQPIRLCVSSAMSDLELQALN